MTLTVIPWPTVDTVRDHMDRDHGADLIINRTASELVFWHDRAHAQFVAFRAPHRHNNTITADDLAGMPNGRLAGILEALPGDDLQALAAAEAARRIRILDLVLLPRIAADGKTVLDPGYLVDGPKVTVRLRPHAEMIDLHIAEAARRTPTSEEPPID